MWNKPNTALCFRQRKKRKTKRKDKKNVLPLVWAPSGHRPGTTVYINPRSSASHRQIVPVSMRYTSGLPHVCFHVMSSVFFVKCSCLSLLVFQVHCSRCVSDYSLLRPASLYLPCGSPTLHSSLMPPTCVQAPASTTLKPSSPTFHRPSRCRPQIEF